MVSVTAGMAILERLAEEQRHVLSAWRGLVLLRRATFACPPSERRWNQLPEHVEDLYPLFRQMRSRGEIQVIAKHSFIYKVTVPYARQGLVDEREVLFELHPYAVLSHLSAMVFHGLTTEQPKGLTITVSSDGTGGLLPIGTEPRDWEGVRRPSHTVPGKVMGRPVQAKRVRPERFFGVAEYEPHGFPMRYTTPERTLIDGLMEPALCGGINTVFRAWALASDMLDLDALVYQVERMGVSLLRQRVGYILTELEVTHSRLEEWRRAAKRGGSSRLVGSEPFASTFDERWNLSINVSTSALREHHG